MIDEERKTLLERLRVGIAERRALASLSPEDRRIAVAVAKATKQREKDRKAFMKENDSLQRLNDNDGYGNSYVQAFGGVTQALVQREGKARGFLKKEDGVWRYQDRETKTDNRPAEKVIKSKTKGVLKRSRGIEL